MTALQQIEKNIEGLFKNAPKLSENTKKSLVNAWPWIALVFGVLQLWAAWALWGLTQVVSRLGNYADNVSLYYTGKAAGVSSWDKTLIYIGLIVLIADAVILLLAFSPLKARAKRGWDLLFLGSLLNLAHSVVSLFISNRGFGSFIMGLIGSGLGFYLLFQVKSFYVSPKDARLADK